MVNTAKINNDTTVANNNNANINRNMLKCDLCSIETKGDSEIKLNKTPDDWEEILCCSNCNHVKIQIDNDGELPTSQKFSSRLVPQTLADYYYHGIDAYVPLKIKEYLEGSNCNPLPARDKPFSENEWRDHQMPDGSIKDFDVVKKHIFERGVEATLRKELWKYLLGYFNPEDTIAERDIAVEKHRNFYNFLKLKWNNMNEEERRISGFYTSSKLIDKDVIRTDWRHPYYYGENNINVDKMRNILVAYCIKNFSLGYVQGMSDLLSPILFVMDNEVDAFWCFEKLMERMESNFKLSQKCTALQLQQLYTLLETVEPTLAAYLKSQESNHMAFTFDWILILFKRQFSLTGIQPLWEVLWTDMPCENYHLLVATAILRFEKDAIINNRLESDEILKHIKSLSLNIDLEKILCEANGIYEHLKNAYNIPSAVLDIFKMNTSATRQIIRCVSSVKEYITPNLFFKNE